MNETEKLTLPPRRGLLGLLGLGFLLSLAACALGKNRTKNDTVLDVEAFSCFDRLITDIIFNGTDLGVMNRYGATGLITGVRIPFGVQTLTWVLDGPAGTPRNGERVTMKNTLVVTPEQIPPGTRYVGLNIYPDETAEVEFFASMPVRSARGKQLKAARK